MDNQERSNHTWPKFSAAGKWISLPWEEEKILSSEVQLCSQHSLKLVGTENVCMIRQGRSGLNLISTGQITGWCTEQEARCIANRLPIFSPISQIRELSLERPPKGLKISNYPQGSMQLYISWGSGLSQEYLEKQKKWIINTQTMIHPIFLFAWCCVWIHSKDA